MSKKTHNLYTHCSICDTFMSGDYQGINPVTKEIDDLCKECRSSVNKAIYFHEEDLVDMKIMERHGWRKSLDGSSDGYDIECDYQGSKDWDV